MFKCCFSKSSVRTLLMFGVDEIRFESNTILRKANIPSEQLVLKNLLSNPDSGATVLDTSDYNSKIQTYIIERYITSIAKSSSKPAKFQRNFVRRIVISLVYTAFRKFTNYISY